MKELEEVTTASRFAITMSERTRYRGTKQVPVTYERVAPGRWAMTVGRTRKAGTLSDGMVAWQINLARSEGRYVSGE